ncbi:phosphatidic acid phosphatase type 2/haloperoxidase, partial [Protomyces lactucae-debilis]
KKAGLSAQNHYQQRLSSLRYSLRARLLPIIRAETPILARLQKKYRTNFLDIYFVYTANAGTHTAFLVFLPMIFWFGNVSFANAMVDTLAAGIFFSGFIKDFFCLPRPLSPPLHRINMSGSAALEYGFPSSHSTNACSVAFYAFAMLSQYEGSASSKLALQCFTALYTATIVFGRLYCGMHGFSDVIAGSILGFSIGWARWAATPIIERWISVPGTLGVFILLISIIILVRLHPEPADACPCFDDGVAFAGVVIGQYFGFWRYSADPYVNATGSYPGHLYMSSPGLSIAGGLLRVLLGVLFILAWRATMKPILFTILPPFYRYLSKAGFLYPRRDFASATKYKTVPEGVPDEVLPSMKELPTLVRNFRRPRTDSVGPQSAADLFEAVDVRDKQRRLSNDATMDYEGAKREDMRQMHGTIEKPRVRYDVEVVTKLVVYTGVGWIAI